MYHKAAGATSTAGGGALAMTGANTIWMIIAAFTLIAAGAAIWRLTPQRSKD